MDDPAASAMMNARLSLEVRPWQWLSFATIFGPAVVLLLILYAIVHGAAGHIIGPVMYLVVFTALWFSAFVLRRRIPRIATFVRFMLPLMLYGAFYVPMHEMLAATGHPLIDARLIAIDRAIFGTEPIAWLGSHGHPLLTDALYLCYFSYYAGMPVLLILMWRGSPEPAFRTALSAMIMGWYGALVTYAIFPAVGPNRFMPELLPLLQGWLPTTEWVKAFLSTNLQSSVRDCVPSMHTGVTLLTLTFAYRFQRRFFRIYLFPGIGVICATVYIQQHYVIDVFLGIIAFVIIYGITTKLELR
jgi:hypothetical protein